MTSVTTIERGHYVCPKCGKKWAWGFGITEKVPPVKNEDRIQAECPPCRGLEFKSPIEILTGKKLQ